MVFCLSVIEDLSIQYIQYTVQVLYTSTISTLYKYFILLYKNSWVPDSLAINYLIILMLLHLQCNNCTSPFPHIEDLVIL